MKEITIDTTITITPQNIDLSSEMIGAALEEMKTSNKTIVQTRLTFEAIMLAWMNKLPEGSECRILLRKRLGRSFISLEVNGNPVNPLKKDTDKKKVNDVLFYYDLLENINVVSNYSYRDGVNYVEIHLPKKSADTVRAMVIAIVLGVVVGMLLTLASSGVKEFLATEIISPTVNALNGLISAIASVFIFTSIVSTFCNVDNMSEFGNIGKKTMTTYHLVNMTVIIVATIASVMLFGEIQSGGNPSKEFLSAIYNLIIDLIPTNLFQPFLDKNLMQIAILAALFGAIMLTLGKRVPTLRAFALNLQQLMVSALEVVCGFLPIVVFLCIINLIIKDQVSVILQSWKMVVFVTVGVWLTTAIICIYAKSIKAIDFSKIKGELFSSMMIGFSTGSRTPCTPQIYDMCLDKLKLREDVVNFAIPTSSMFCVYQKAFSMVMFVFGMLPIFNVSVTLTQILAVFIALNIIIYTIPPVPMGSITVVAILWTMVGIPDSAMAIAMPIDIIFGMIGTPAVVAGTVAIIAIISKQINQAQKKIK